MSTMGEPLIVGLPLVSSSVTVKAFAAEEEAAALMAGEVMASLCAFPAVMVSAWVPEVRPVPAALMTGLPEFVSPK